MSKLSLFLSVIMVLLVVPPALGSIAIGNPWVVEPRGDTSLFIPAAGQNQTLNTTNSQIEGNTPTTTEEEPTSDEKLRMIVNVINTETPLSGAAHVTVTFDNEKEFRTENRTITAEDRVAFPMSMPQQPDVETANVCAIVEGEENNCDNIALDPEDEGVLRVNLELINFEELEPVS